MAHGTCYETITTERGIIERKYQKALDKLTFCTMAACVKWHWVQWNWVNCHITVKFYQKQPILNCNFN